MRQLSPECRIGPWCRPSLFLQRADLAVGAITISYDRELVVSFTKPYRDIQLGILLAQPAHEQYDPWSFLTPLSNRLWAVILVSAVLVALVISLLDKLSPYGHYGWYSQNTDG